ncbi:MAG: cell shape determination protein CcmA [Candidatus Doudnabacteria bacterium CG10_big_fil_rev_8_21_14_0_10_41_10]|uniref:Cell shape determination protein CcmA n=1 Tax=Candidatus Doudnabacteria bacterium CG10_big_fil_rev_8_21_14_0_10_41_10 TaxID=1974551 RepID=A0A2H0VC96_9BACT|nr:MAG: cell shape determination protein CcmA [Candidatus Doudnabacteria bacterium CG10_big_fil_rev_8_21_14_0_10_41_10]
MAKDKDKDKEKNNIMDTSQTEDAQPAETVVGHSVKIEGDLVSEGDIKVDGIVMGKVKTAKSLFIGPSAKIEADVEAGTVTVAGVVHGNMKVKGLLVALQTGKILGDIDCKELAIEEGAFFTGQCKMTERNESKKISKPTLDDED